MDWLANYRAELRRAIAAIGRIDGKKLALDIAARRLDRALARNYARNRLRLNEELDAIGVSEAKWCQTLGRGNSLSQMRRRLQFQKPGAWQRYLTHRREKGDNGVYGLEYAVFLAKEKDGNGTSARPTRVQSANKTLDPDKVNLITGDGVEEMSKMPPESVNVIIKSPPYWPARRIFDPDGKPTGIGFEPTFEEYLHNLVHKFGRAEKRVLRDDGVLCVVLDDAIAQPPTYYGVQNYNRNRAPAKLASQTGFRTQDSTYLRPKGNWLLLPFRLALAMQDDGWYLRDIIIIDKGARGRKESSPNRTRHSFEYLFMFTKTADGYYYDQDELRVPLAHAIRGGTLDFRTLSNPLGRVCDAVWHVPPGYPGDHAATFSEELVRRCLLLMCPPNGRVLDPMGGPGTVAVVASQMGFSVTSIDLNPHYTEEARQRVLTSQVAPVMRSYKVNGTDIRSDLDGLIRDRKRFRGILADVPWRAWATRGKPGAADSHYDWLELEDIAAIRVAEVATDDAFLFLWTLHVMLEEAFWVMRAWGFENATTGAVWSKTNGFGTGSYFRMQHEHLLVGRRPGTPTHFVDRAISSVINAPRTRPSEKPAEVHNMIERALGGRGPFLELFGRRHVPDWTVLGNQLPRRTRG